MKNIRLIYLMALVQSTDLYAQQITVTTGQHDNFTRAAFEYDDVSLANLSIEEVSGASGIVIRSDHEFVLSNVYQRISGERISEITITDGGLYIKTACDCRVEQRILARYAYVDIIDDPADGPTDISRVKEVFEKNHQINRVTALATHNDIAVNLANRISKPSHNNEIATQINSENSNDYKGFGRMELSEVLLGNINGADHQDDKLVKADDLTVCVDNLIFDASFEGVSAPLSEINKKNIAIFNEQGDLVPDRAIESSRYMISLGLGEEARGILSLLDDPKAKVYYWISGILEGDKSAQGVDTSVLCGPNIQFWHYLSGNRNQLNRKHSSAEILGFYEYFIRQSTQLQKVLAQRFVDELHQDGATEVADMVLFELAPKIDRNDSDLQLALAKSGLADLTPAETLADMESLLTDRPTEAVAPLGVLIEQRLLKEEGVSDRYLRLAATYLTEYEQTDLGADVWLTLIRGKLSNDDFDGAYRTIIEENTWIEQEEMKSAIDDFTRAVLESENDSIFLKYFWGQEVWFYDGVAGELKIEVANRLLDLGFPEEVEKYLNSGNLDLNSETLKLVMARAHLKMGNASEAELVLTDLNSPSAIALRSQARRMLGDYQYASALEASIGSDQDTAFLDWMSGSTETPAVRQHANLQRYAPILNKYSENGYEVATGNRDLLRKVQEDRELLSQLVELGWSQ